MPWGIRGKFFKGILVKLQIEGLSLQGLQHHPPGGWLYHVRKGSLAAICLFVFVHIML